MMQRGFWSKFLSLAALSALSVWLLYPTYVYYYGNVTPEQKADNKVFCQSMPSWAHCRKVTLGLDLQGGLHLVMGVVVDKAVSDKAERYADMLADRLKDKEFGFDKIRHDDEAASISVTLKDAADEDKFRRFVREDFGVLEVVERTDGGKQLKLAINEADQKRIKDEAVEQAIKTIRNRADKYGVSEPTIARRGQDNILIQLPGVKDPDRAIDIIGKTAQLEFAIVDDDVDVVDKLDKLPDGVKKDYEGAGKGGRSAFLRAPTKEAIYDTLRGKLDDAHAVKVEEVREKDGKLSGFRSYIVYKKSGVTGDYLTDATVQFSNEEGRHYVGFSFDSQGGKLFEKLTGDNIGRRLAIVLDDVIFSAPTIQSKIGSQGRITLGGYKTQQEIMDDAKSLALVLKSGALAAPVIIREQRRVGATLGSEAVQKGTLAMYVGLFLVVLAMIVYYRVSGAIANVALIFNFLFIIALLAGLEATLTLPGMAGIALTLGMAVDANVIILERIREELRHGKTVRAAIESGYDRAFWTIVDSHVTQLVSAVILWQYGSGPIRGFATTMIIGISASLYTSVVITKMIYDGMSSKAKLDTLSI